MPTEKLTAKRVEASKPDPGRDRIDLFDAITPGLSLRITKNGSKSWVVNYRSPVERDRRGQAKVKRFTFGKFPYLSLVDARRNASTIMQNIAEGHDPLVERKDARVVEASHGADPVTVQEGVARYVQEHVKAYMWWSLAKAQGNKMAASNLDIITKEMNTGQIGEAQKLAAEMWERINN